MTSRRGNGFGIGPVNTLKGVVLSSLQDGG